TKTAVFPGAVSYEIDGEQYVAIAVGGPVQGGYYAPNGARMLAFKLGGNLVLPDLPEFTERPIAPPPQFAAAATITQGQGCSRNAASSATAAAARRVRRSPTCAAHRHCMTKRCSTRSCSAASWRKKAWPRSATTSTATTPWRCARTSSRWPSRPWRRNNLVRRSTKRESSSYGFPPPRE